MYGSMQSWTRLMLPMTLLVSAFSPPSEPLQVAGTIALTATPAAPGKGPDGRPLFVGTSRGRNQSTGRAEFMDGAEVLSADTASLVNGTGPHHGYLTMSKGQDRMAYRWSGTVTTVVAADKTPRSTAQGTWTVLRGTGKYAGISGGGTYQGRFTSSTASVIEWQGKLAR